MEGEHQEKIFFPSLKSKYKSQKTLLRMNGGVCLGDFNACAKVSKQTSLGRDCFGRPVLFLEDHKPDRHPLFTEARHREANRSLPNREYKVLLSPLDDKRERMSTSCSKTARNYLSFPSISH